MSSSTATSDNTSSFFSSSTVGFFFIFLISTTHATTNGRNEAADFQLSFQKADGEVENFYAHHGRIAHELKLAQAEDNKLRILRVSDGKLLVSLVYDSDGKLADCDVTESTESIEEFSLHFNATSLPALNSIPDGRHKRFSLDGNDFMNMHKTVKECKKWHKKVDILVKSHKRDEESGQSEKKERKQRRKKRSIMIFPGTNWCGKGNQAKYVTDFGENGQLDRCCLEHDGCPYIIEGFTSRFNYFNYRFHTLSYCDCDQKFRECLMKTGEGSANMVGRMYFNMMNTQCFDLERERVCSKRSWWGTCNQENLQLVAKVRNQNQF